MMRRYLSWLCAGGLCVCGLIATGCGRSAPEDTVDVPDVEISTPENYDLPPLEMPPADATAPAETAPASPPADGATAPATTEEPAADAPAPAADAPAPGTDTPAPAAAAPAAAAEATETLTPVPMSDGSVSLTPENTRIEFVGIHSGEKPDPRLGGFEKLAGKVVVDPASKSLQSITLDVDTTSVWTQFPKLTDHLKSPDFFEVRQFPKLTFESTKITAEEDGKHQVTGQLTLHGVTKDIVIPAQVRVTDEGLTVHSEFSIFRSEFGMDFGLDRVENKVAITVVVGQKTQPR